MAKVSHQPTRFDRETTQRMLDAVAREARSPAQRTGIGPAISSRAEQR